MGGSDDDDEERPLAVVGLRPPEEDAFETYDLVGRRNEQEPDDEVTVTFKGEPAPGESLETFPDQAYISYVKQTTAFGALGGAGMHGVVGVFAVLAAANGVSVPAIAVDGALDVAVGVVVVLLGLHAAVAVVVQAVAQLWSAGVHISSTVITILLTSIAISITIQIN